MSILTQLSDAELDHVTGGSSYFSFTSVRVTKIASNVNLSSQSQTNVGILQFASFEGGAQENSTSQLAIA